MVRRMVVVPKCSGAVRICIDLKPQNKSVLREVHPIPTVDDTLAQLSGASVFTKLDVNSGFWQISLAKKSQLLTTFVTPFGRYCFNKFSFGISSAPELFQRRINQVLEGLSGVLCLMDDVLVFGETQDEHDRRLKQVMEKQESTGVTLNVDKCEFSQDTLQFLGHIVDKNGIRPEPEKTRAISGMESPQTVTDLHRFLGIANNWESFPADCQS